MILRQRSLLVASDQRPSTSDRVAHAATTTLMIATVLLLLMLLGAAIAAWTITRQPPEQRLQVPSVSQAYFS
jgi:hypothetical protein